MIINYDTINGHIYVRIEAQSIDEVQNEIDRLHGRIKFIGPHKDGDKYVAVGMEE